MKKATISDVAELAGVSNATVSAVINNKDTVRDSTRRKVLHAIEELNYRPSASAQRRFRTSADKSIGLVVKEMHNPYFADVIVGAREMANKKGYTVLVASSESSVESEHDIVELLAGKDIDGLVINPLLDEHADLSHLFEIKRRNIPFVLLESVRGLQANIVDVDNVRASQTAVKYLIDGGHTRIAHFAGPKYSMHSDERIEGVRRAFSESRLVFSSDFIVHAGARVEDGHRAGIEYFEDFGVDDRPTAVTCYNDLVAIGLIKALSELGIRVPDDVSVIGYDDIKMGNYVSVPLTTVHVPKVEMGAKAVERLIAHIENPGARSVDKVTLETDLVLRASTRVLDGAAKEADA